MPCEDVPNDPLLGSSSTWTLRRYHTKNLAQLDSRLNAFLLCTDWKANTVLAPLCLAGCSATRLEQAGAATSTAYSVGHSQNLEKLEESTIRVPIRHNGSVPEPQPARKTHAGFAANTYDTS